MTLSEIFASRAHSVSWGRLDDRHIVGGQPPKPIEPHQAYFRLRLKEMYLAYSRKLWFTLYPMVFSFTDHGETHAAAIAGPGQLGEIGGAHPERVVVLNYPLTGPIVYTGEELSILIGLCSTPSDDLALGFVETMAAITPLVGALGGHHLGPATEMVKIFKKSLEHILELDGSSLQLGIRDNVNAGGSLRPGAFCATNARKTALRPDDLWLRDGRLLYGPNPPTAKPFDVGDFMLVEIERLDARDDWARLSGIAAFQEKFRSILLHPTSRPLEKRQSIAQIWPEFLSVVEDSKDFTIPDRLRISSSVKGDLKRRLDAMESGKAFETKGVGEPTDPSDFSYADVIAPPSPSGVVEVPQTF